MMRPTVVRFGALGDMVLMTVAIRALADRFGSNVDVIGSGDWTAPLLRDQPGVGEVYVLGSRSKPYWLAPDQWHLIRSLRRRGSGAAWLFDAQTDRIRGLLRKAGWRPDELLSLDRIEDIPDEHFCDHWLRFAALPISSAVQGSAGGTWDAPLSTAHPELVVSAAIRDEVASWLAGIGLATQPFILIQAGNKRTMRRGSPRRASNTKYWPEERWADLLKELRERHPQHAILLLGVSAEATINDEILELASIPSAYNLARQMSVPRLMGLSERAFGMVSVDTGPAHVAAAVGCRLLTLFDSPTKRVMYEPRGPGIAARCLVGGTDESPSLLGVSPADVISVWSQLDR